MSASFAARSSIGAATPSPRSGADGLPAPSAVPEPTTDIPAAGAAGGLRILLVDDDDLILESMGIFLDTGLARASVTKYNTLERGRPGADFDWSGYDVLLIDYNLGHGDTVLDWLDGYATSPGFPPTVVLLPSEDPETERAARARGAGVCLSKTRLNPDELVGAVKQVLEAATPSDTEPHAETVILPGMARAARAGSDLAQAVRPAPAPEPAPAHDETMVLPRSVAARDETPPALRVLLVDDEELILDTLEIFLQGSFPGVEVTKYHTLSRGRPDEGFDWSAFDVLLLDFNLGNGDTGVEWLDAYSTRPGFPRTVLLTGSSDPVVVGTAVSSGASAYLNKTRLDPEGLATTVKDLLARETAPPAASPQGEDDGGARLGRASLDAGNDRGCYRFVRLIGRGAMARVYLAERDGDRQTAVVKILDRHVARDPENVQRFTLEGELLASIDSPYVATIFDHGTSDGLGFIAMEFFGRGDLAQRISRGVSPHEAVLYLHNIACGLQEVHRKGIVHRDLKPANIMFRGDGSMALADFGIAKPMDSDLSLTASGVILGTPYCMSPEQTEGRDADVRSDLYATGVLYYEMLTGTRPFDGPTLPALLMAIQTEPVPRLEASMASHQPVLDRLLAKDPDDRFQSASELIEALLSLPDAP